MARRGLNGDRRGPYPKVVVPRNISGFIRTVAKLALLSLLVGLAMSLFGITPGNVLSRVAEGARDAVRWAGTFLAWAWTYIVIGAVLVVPIWLLLRLLRPRRRE